MRTAAGTQADPTPRTAWVHGAVALTAVIVGTAGAGWLLGIEALTRPLANSAAMSPLTACTLAVAALGLWLCGPAPTGPRGNAGHTASATVAVVGLAGLVDAVTGMGLDLNARLFGADAEMAVTTATSLLFLGAGMRTLDHQTRGHWRAQVLLLAAFAIGLAGLVGYALGVELYYGASRSVEMSPLTAMSICVLATGVLAARPGRGITRVVLANSLGGRFARRAIPVAVVVPVLCGVAASIGARQDWFSGLTATWLATLGGVFALAALSAWTAAHLHDEDRLRRDFEERLVRVAATDPLTGLLNRRAFELELARAAARTGRHDQERWCVCVIDLDHFKELNDRHGHQAGDEALRRVAHELSRRLRAGDVLARTGGDEFVALLAHVDVEAARQVADDLVAAVGEVAVALTEAGYPSRLWASAGVAEVDGSEEDPGAEALRRADVQMYRAKRAART